jgi:hypothetical protein
LHIYHRQITGMAGCMGDPLYRAPWEEGLATDVSGVLNPQVSESAILVRPEDLAARAKPLLSQIARELLQNMDSTSPDLYQTFFLGNTTGLASNRGEMSGFQVDAKSTFRPSGKSPTENQ